MANISSSSGRSVPASQENTGQTYRGPFAVMTVLFFMWGFITVLNDILIPRLQDAFSLSNYKIMFVQTAFFGAYFTGSLLYFIISATAGDPIARIGYKNGVVIGLLLAAIGSAMFWPAATIPSYPFFLAALFVVGLGLTMLQIAANPYVTILGPERTASSRLNLAQAFNSVGTTIGPLIGGRLIYQYFARTGANGAESVRIPYLAFCIVFALIAIVFFFLKLPHVGEGKIEPGMGALKYPHVVLGVVAIFMYVGGEVSIGSQIIKFLGEPNVAGLTALEATQYVSLFWGGMLIGRFMGSVELSEMAPMKKQVLLALIPIGGFLLFWLMRSWDIDHHNFDFAGGWAIVKNYLPLLFLCWLLFQFGQAKAARTLLIFSVTIVVLLAAAIVMGGRMAMWCVVGVGLFTSIGWSNTFSLALEGTGIYKSQVSSLLVMAILGGAVLPPILGKVADHSSRQLAFIVPLIAYAYVGFYGWKGYKIGRSEELVSS